MTRFYLIVLLCFASVKAQAKRSRLHFEEAPYKLPDFHLQLLEKYETNFNQLSGDSDPLLTHGLILNTSFINEFDNGGKFTYSPRISGDYAPTRSSKIIEGSFKNGLAYSLDTDEFNTISFASSINYVNNFDFNDIQERVKNRVWSFSFAPTWSYQATENLNFTGTLKAEVADFLSSTSSIQPDEADNLNYSGLATVNYQLSEVLKLIVPIYRLQTLQRTRKSLLATGQEGGLLAEETNFTTVAFAVEIKKEKFTITPKIGLRRQRDVENGGKDFDGIEVRVDLGYVNENFSYAGYFRSRSSDYLTQLADLTATPETSPTYELTWIQVYNTLTFKSVFDGVDISISHNRNQFKGNRQARNSTNQAFILGFDFTL